MIVMVEAVVPSETTGPEPVICEVVPEGTPAVKVTVPLLRLIGEVIESVFTSARFDDKEQIETPLASELEQGP
jgi:hypothetical protein